jgi:parvulin-like peptidyl-prolyl isomerase
MRVFGVCLNWKVVGVLGVAALAVLVLAPGLSASILPVLLVLACPLSMVFMMRSMGSSGGRAVTTPAPVTEADREATIARLEAEVASLRDERRGAAPPAPVIEERLPSELTPAK